MRTTNQRILDKAKIGLMRKTNSVFISSILFGLKQQFVDKSSGIETAATDGLNLMINPEWFNELEKEEQIGLLAHECYHVVFQHMQRGAALDHDRYNNAADYVINLILTEAGLTLPPDGLLDKAYKGMSTRQVYDKLPKQPPGGGGNGSGPGGGQGNGPNNDVIYDKNPNSQAAKDRDMEITNNIIKAMTQSQIAGETHGNIPQEIKRMIDEIINPVLPWNNILQNFMSEFARDDYSYRRPNRRFMPDFYLPSQYSEHLANISVAIDLSGSITEEELQAFLSEIKYIHETMQPQSMSILGFDTKIHEIHEVTEGEDILDLHFSGGGGTKITPVLKHFNKTKPTVAIIFTDMEFEEYKVDPEFEHIWIVIDNPELIPRDGTYAHYNFE